MSLGRGRSASVMDLGIGAVVESDESAGAVTSLLVLLRNMAARSCEKCSNGEGKNGVGKIKLNMLPGTGSGWLEGDCFISVLCLLTAI